MLTFERRFIFLVSRRNIELKTSKHKFTDIIYHNKKRFKGKKLSGTEFSAFRGKIITSFLLQFSRFCLLVILQNPSKIICLTCIWLKFVDPSFHSSQKPPQITHKSCRIKSNRHTFKFLKKIVAWSSKHEGGWNWAHNWLNLLTSCGPN